MPLADVTPVIGHVSLFLLTLGLCLNSNEATVIVIILLYAIKAPIYRILCSTNSEVILTNFRSFWKSSRRVVWRLFLLIAVACEDDVYWPLSRLCQLPCLLVMMRSLLGIRLRVQDMLPYQQFLGLGFICVWEFHNASKFMSTFIGGHLQITRVGRTCLLCLYSASIILMYSPVGVIGFNTLIYISSAVVLIILVQRDVLENFEHNFAYLAEISMSCADSLLCKFGEWTRIFNFGLFNVIHSVIECQRCHVFYQQLALVVYDTLIITCFILRHYFPAFSAGTIPTEIGRSFMAVTMAIICTVLFPMAFIYNIIDSCKGIRNFPMASKQQLEYSKLCVVCLTEMHCGRVTPCHHVMHGGCLLQWLNFRDICPMCRQTLKFHDR
ncbi:uncharacterized protein [Ptychodera flava]|uniref:uncharacterized protein n=1 Tax=Ptychodera flava TaxID=63121 RepID=UPI00396AA709